MTPEHDRTNPQRAIDEYKKNTPPLIKLGQGREEQPSDKTVEVIYVSSIVFALIALLMYVCYLAGGWQ